MSYFIFKDISSENFNNLIVENLPPISSPPQRYDIQEIDGSSKVNITELGYKAYEKPIKLGFKNHDTYNVESWLKGKGKLILSNELDKYYDAFVLEQIDYKQVLRFKTATVTFLVQPYKHATGEEETTSRVLINQGNTECLPLMTIYGSGSVGVLVNGVKQCDITVDGYVTLDGEEEEAYKDNLDNRRNRVMIGKFPVFKPGENELSFTGNVTNVKTLVRSRWL